MALAAAGVTLLAGCAPGRPPPVTPGPPGVRISPGGAHTAPAVEPAEDLPCRDWRIVCR